MTATLRLKTQRLTLPFALGLSDGIFNALILASAEMLRDRSPITVMLALRVGCVAFVTGALTLYVAEYADQRMHLSRASRQLNLTSEGHLATTALRRRVIGKSARAAATASLCSFVGATSPLVVSGIVSRAQWLGVVLAIILLGVLGTALARGFEARAATWAAGLMVSGVIVAAVGTWLNIT